MNGQITRRLFIVYLLIGLIGAAATSAFPLIYADYGFSSSQIYHLISAAFLATSLQPLMGYIVDRIGDRRGISMLLFGAAIFALLLSQTTNFYMVLVLILLFSIFRFPLIPILDGYSSSIAIKYNLNMASMRVGSTFGFGFGILVLGIFLSVTKLPTSYCFILLALYCLLAVPLLLSIKGDAQTTTGTNNNEERKTDWPMLIVLFVLQLLFFGFTVLKVNYITPMLIEYDYSGTVVAIGAVIGIIPVFILFPLFKKLFAKFRPTTLISFCLIINIAQTIIYIVFPTNQAAIYIASFLSGFIFPIYPPVFGMILNSVANPRYRSTIFTAAYTLQNFSVFVFNQFVLIGLMERSGTSITTFKVCLISYTISLIPLLILRVKKY